MSGRFSESKIILRIAEDIGIEDDYIRIKKDNQKST